MSTNVSFTGLSLKIHEDKSNKESLIELAKYLEYSEKEIESLNNKDYLDYFYETKKNTWRIYIDHNRQLGLIYLIDNEYDAFDLVYNLSMETINELLGLLLERVPKEYLNMDAENVKTFAYLYYNGTDSPFTF